MINLENLSGQGGPGHTGGQLQLLAVPQGGQVLTAPAVWINPGDSSTWVFVTNGSGSSGLKLTFPGGAPTLATQWQNTLRGFSPLVANNVLYFAGGNIIRALDPLTGNVLWSDTAHVGGNHWESPIVVNATLYITDESAHLTAYALPPAGGSPTPTPTLTRTPTPTATNTSTPTGTVAPTLTPTPSLPDLVVSSVNAPSKGRAGQTIKVTDTTDNSGIGPAGPSTTRYYLSTDPTPDAGDAALGSRSVPALQPGSSNRGSVNVLIPSGTPPGTYYVIGKADVDNVVAENNETNNANTHKIVIGHR